MKAKFGLSFLSVLLCCSMAFAVNGTGYYNLTQKFTGFGAAQYMTVVLSQGKISCNDLSWNSSTSFQALGSCIASLKDTPANLYELLQKYWVSNLSLRGVSLELGSDIDLGEYTSKTEAGKCDVNHVPLPMMSSNAFDGNQFTISHLCYAKTVTTDDAMTKPVGFFETADHVSLKNVRMKNIRIYIDGESGRGKDYYPVGALAGSVNMSTIENVKLIDDSIRAPMAGGLVGFVQNSTIKNISGDDDIIVSNAVKITQGFAGSGVILSSVSVYDYQVFLGGLVGLALRNENDDSSFKDDSVKVIVRDEASGHKSTLGGVAGMLITKGEVIENLKVYTKYKPDDTLASDISGGSSMGGLFGARMVYTEYNNPTQKADFVLSGSSFSGNIRNSSSPDMVALGGLIGRDSSVAGKSVLISKGTASIMIEDSLKTAGLYRYYAGGVIGYGSACGSSNTGAEDFVSITESRAAGYINVAGSGQAIDGLHSQTYLGGIAGHVCVAQAENKGLVDDTAVVDIDARVRTSVDNKKVSNGTYARDSLFVGGVVGFARVRVSESSALSRLYYMGNISVLDSLNHVAVGGIVGGFPQDEGGKSIRFKDIRVVGKTLFDNDLISYKAVEGSTTAKSLQTAKLGGLCGVCNEVAMIERVGVSGNIRVTGKYSGDSLLVGGILGGTRSSVNDFVLKNSFVNGDVLVTATAKQKKCGYLVGSAVWNSPFTVMSSYHYGENDLELKPFGLLSDGIDLTDSWLENENIRYVVRNGETKNLAPETQNGDEITDSMKASRFAGFLNKNYSSAGDYVWSYKKGENNDLPIFADDKNAAIEPALLPKTYVVVFADRDGKTIKQETVNEGENAVAPAAEDLPTVDGYTFSNWDKDFSNITSDLTVSAVYTINYYTVKFLDYDDRVLSLSSGVEYLGSATPPAVIAERTGYDFIGWDDSSYTEVKKDLDIRAVYRLKVFTITFVDYDGSLVRELSLAYNSPVSEPIGLTREKTADYKYTFKKWNPDVVPVEGDAVYKAVYDSTEIEHVSSSSEVSSSPEKSSNSEASSSSENSSSSGVSSSSEWSSSSRTNSNNGLIISSSSGESPESSGSGTGSSSSAGYPGSSSAAGELKLVRPKIEQSGNAVRLTFDAECADSNTEARVVVSGEKGVIVDTVLETSVIDGGVWEMAPAPMGKFTVELVLDDSRRKAVFESRFEVASEIMVRPESWQMVALSAMENALTGQDDDATLFWWDEENPVGDYWQYRAFSGGDIEMTRGFWYGSSTGKSLVLRETAWNRDSEIVWKLDSLYSGWNMVANPYGWYVDLSKGEADDGSKVTFWRWNPTTSEYEIPSVIGPYEAVWAKAPHALTWRVSAAPVFGMDDATDDSWGDSYEPLKKTLKKSGEKGFALVASLADENGKRDSWNVFGAGVEESLGEPPAGMGDHVSLAIREVNDRGEKGAKLSKSIKAVASEYRWILELSANSARDGKLSFEGLSDLNKLGLKLFVTIDGKTTEVENGKSLNVELAKSARSVEVRVAKSNVSVASAKLGALRPVMAENRLRVQFDVPESLAGAKASYAVMGVNGKKVAAGRFTASEGTNLVDMSVTRTGLYFVKVKVGSQELSGKVLKK